MHWCVELRAGCVGLQAGCTHAAGWMHRIAGKARGATAADWVHAGCSSGARGWRPSRRALRACEPQEKSGARSSQGQTRQRPSRRGRSAGRAAAKAVGPRRKSVAARNAPAESPISICTGAVVGLGLEVVVGGWIWRLGGLGPEVGSGAEGWLRA